MTTDHFAIDCLNFIDALVLAGKISGRAATAAAVRKGCYDQNSEKSMGGKKLAI